MKPHSGHCYLELSINAGDRPVLLRARTEGCWWMADAVKEQEFPPSHCGASINVNRAVAAKHQPHSDISTKNLLISTFVMQNRGNCHF